MAERPRVRKSSYAEHESKLRLACQWLGIQKGRAADYVRVFKEWKKKGSRSPKHILAYNESCEILDLFELWQYRVSEFPGLQLKIREVFSKGPILREEEVLTASSNKARNDAFVFLTAGKLLQAGISVVAVEGVIAASTDCKSKADITVQCADSFIDIECKRPQSFRTLQRRVKDARNQIAKRGDRHGVIAIDCSVLCRSPGTVFGNAAPEDAQGAVSNWLERQVCPKIASLLDAQILGYVLLARFPSMTPLEAVGESQRTIHRSDCISSWLVLNNSMHTDSGFLRCVANKLQEAQAIP